MVLLVSGRINQSAFTSASIKWWITSVKAVILLKNKYVLLKDAASVAFLSEELSISATKAFTVELVSCLTHAPTIKNRTVQFLWFPELCIDQKDQATLI